MTIFNFRSGGSAALFLHQYFGVEKRAEVVRALAGDTDLHRLCAFVACRRVEIQTIAAGVQVRAAVPALGGHLDGFFENLDFGGAVVTTGDPVEFRFNSAACTLRTWRRFGSGFALPVLVSGLTVLSVHVHRP